VRYFLPLVALLCALAPARATGCVTGAFYAPQVVAPQVIQPAQYVAPVVAQQAVEAYSAPVLAVRSYSAPVVAALAGGYGGYGHGASAFAAPEGGRQQAVEAYSAPVLAVRGYSAPVVAAFTGGYGGYGHGASAFAAPVVVRQRAFAVRGFQGGFGGLAVVAGRRNAVVVRGRGLGLFRGVRAPAIVIRGRR